MSAYESDYRGLLLKILGLGDKAEGRNGWTKSIFNATLEVDLARGFPLLKGRKMHTKGIFAELCCFVQGLTDLQEYVEMGCNYWTKNAEAWVCNDGLAEADYSIGQYVGALWRDFSSAAEVQSDSHTPRDQLRELYLSLRDNPSSRRHVLSAWHPGAEACLPPCTVMAIFDVRKDKLNCHVTQRSADMCLGVPSDVAGYALLMHALCFALGTENRVLSPGRLCFSFINAHIYQKHESSTYKYLQQGYGAMPSLPSLQIVSPYTGFSVLANLVPDHIALQGYEPNGAINFPFVV